jgi:hypothetical protein
MEYHFDIEIFEKALNDIDEAYRYYTLEKKSISTGEKFIREVYSQIDSLKIYPFYQVKYKNYISYPMKNFPFIIFLEVFEDINLVKILRIFNTNQDSAKYPE